jgi:hypothetical protein
MRLEACLETADYEWDAIKPMLPKGWLCVNGSTL